MRCLILLLAVAMVHCNPFKTVFSWKQVDYNFPNNTMRKSYVDSGRYIQENAVPLGLNVWGEKLFIAVPRWKKGVPANLNYINLSEAEAAKNKSPLLNPYPDWESNDINLPDSLVNILRIRVDACDRLWAVDSGVDDMNGERKRVQSPKQVAIDLNTNKIILSYRFKDSDIKPTTFFGDTAVDVDPNNCGDAYVYNSDLGSYGLLVYSMAKNESWRIDHNYFHFDPPNSNFHVSGFDFQWTDGVFGLALSSPKEDGSKTLFFHSLAGLHEFSVSTNIIKNQTALADPAYWKEFQIAGFKGFYTQGTSSMMDTETGIIYFTQVNRNAIACWDTHKRLNPGHFKTIAKDDERLVFPSDISIEPKSRKLWCISNKLPVNQFGKYNPEITNFYVHVASLDDFNNICRCIWTFGH